MSKTRIMNLKMEVLSDNGHVLLKCILNIGRKTALGNVGKRGV